MISPDAFNGFVIICLVLFVFLSILFYFAIIDLFQRINHRREAKNKRPISIIIIKKILISLFLMELFFLAFMIHFYMNDLLPCIVAIIFFCGIYIFNGYKKCPKKLKSDKLFRTPFLIGLILSILITIVILIIGYNFSNI